MVSNLDAKVIRADLDHLSGKLMPEDSRIGIGGMPSGERMEITSAHPHLANANDCLSLHKPWYGRLTFYEFPRASKYDLSHKLCMAPSLSGLPKTQLIGPAI